MKVVFFEKPGCINNTRQKRVLTAAGHEVEAFDLLGHPWTEPELLQFLGDRPVQEWFNRSSPRVKSKEIVPEQLSFDQALSLMLGDPLLIRRPLIKTSLGCVAGWDTESDDLARIGLILPQETPDLSGCARPGGDECAVTEKELAHG